MTETETEIETNEGNDKHQSKAERKQNTYQEATATAELGWVAAAKCGTRRAMTNNKAKQSASRTHLPRSNSNSITWMGSCSKNLKDLVNMSCPWNSLFS